MEPMEHLEAFYDGLAEHLARDAHENHFDERRGVWWIEDEGAVCVFNNNPYANDPLGRDAELLKIRERFEAEGYRELGFGTWPPRSEFGTETEYSYAILIDAPEDSVGWFDKMLTEVTLSK